MNPQTAYPLAWPEGWPRRASFARQRARFAKSHNAAQLTLARTRDEVLDELRKLGAARIVISTNLELRNDGLPRSGQKMPEDPAVAVYFELKGEPKCIPIDKFSRVEENLHAAALVIDALRGLERWGAPKMVDAAFRGFKALPERAGGRAWWDVLAIDSEADVDTIRAAYRKLAMIHHPDKGGSVEEFAELQQALGHGVAARGGR